MNHWISSTHGDSSGVIIEDRIEFALIEVGRLLLARRYRFITPTPETHRRVLRNELHSVDPLRAAFGWSMPVSAATLDPDLLSPLRAVGLLDETQTGEVISRVRFSSVGDLLFAHSAYPTNRPDSVFFGPDTYRFCALIEAALLHTPMAHRIVDIGCGSGVGGIVAATRFPNAQLVLADINPLALSFARANAHINGVSCVCVESDVFTRVDGDADFIVSNPPYLFDDSKRLYRHGGQDFGAELSVRIVEESLPRLRKGGTLALYTGSAVVQGLDTFWEGARPILEKAGRHWSYRELDPDVFGEELDRPAYACVDRIAAVGLTVNGVTQ